MRHPQAQLPCKEGLLTPEPRKGLVRPLSGLTQLLVLQGHEPLAVLSTPKVFKAAWELLNLSVPVSPVGQNSHLALGVCMLDLPVPALAPVDTSDCYNCSILADSIKGKACNDCGVASLAGFATSLPSTIGVNSPVSRGSVLVLLLLRF